MWYNAKIKNVKKKDGGNHNGYVWKSNKSSKGSW